MPPVTLSAISNSATKVRWREPYASEGLNRKTAVVIPPGVYRGLVLGVSASNLSVDLVPDLVVGDHVAVHESTTGFSLTYIDDTSGTITLPLTAFASNDVVVICLVVNYTTGSATTGEFRGYELSEYDALSATVRNSLVVLGTVLRPAAGIIPAVNITHDRRKLPFLNRTDESTPWNPLIRNGGFELSATSNDGNYASPFWRTGTTNVNFAFRAVTTEAKSGAKSLEMYSSAAGTVTGQVVQEHQIQVTPGRYIMSRLYKKVLQAATGSPVGRIRFTFVTTSGGSVNEDMVFAVDAVDASFIEVTGVIKVPSNAAVLSLIEYTVGGTYAASGPKIRIDDVQAWLQVDGAQWLDVVQSANAEVGASRLMLGNGSGFAPDAARIYYGTSHSDAIEIERRYPSQLIPAPAISIPARNNIACKYSLVFVSIPPGSPGYRKYVSKDGNMLEVVNASYDIGTDTWSKDIPGINALRNETSTSGVLVYERVADADWLDSAWAAQYTAGTAPTFTQSATFTQPIKHGDRPLQLGSNWFQYDTTGAGDDSVFRDGGFIQIMSATTIRLELPLIVGDRVKSFTIQVSGNGVSDISAIRFQRCSLGISTDEIPGTQLLNPGAGWASYPFTLPGGETLLADQSFLIEFVITGTMQLGSSTVVYDHP
jgi:hypothetical protein